MQLFIIKSVKFRVVYLSVLVGFLLLLMLLWFDPFNQYKTIKSLKKSSFHQALRVAKKHVNITKNDIKATLDSRKSVLDNNEILWVEKEGTVSMLMSDLMMAQ